jgi:mannan endo-1,4-beta-mannosidase
MQKLYTTLCLIFIGFTAFSQNGNSVLTIDGRLLKDSCGETIILRGVNHGNIWTPGLGIQEFAQIAQTNANCVRICLERTYIVSYKDGNPVYDSLRGPQIDSILQAALDLKLIPIVELHDFTDGSPQHSRVQANLDSAVMFWKGTSVMVALKKHSRFLILNLANEPEHGNDSELEFYNACSSAIAGIRTAGLKVPIMIDGMLWGQDHQFFINNGNGANLLAGDPEHKLFFSVHTYWDSSLVPDVEMTNRFTNMFNSNLPYVIGEFAYDIGTTCTNTINYHLIMDLCQQYSIGYLYWWWGFYDVGSNNCLSMTHTGTYAGLANQGLEVARTYPNSIEKTSVKPHLITNGNCLTGINENNDSFEISVSPNPSDGTFTLNSIHSPITVKLLDLLGNEIPLTKTDANSFSISSAHAGIYIIIVSMANGGQAIIKLIVQ